MRPWRPCAPSGTKTCHRLQAASTRPKASWLNRVPRGSLVLPSGSAVGAAKPAFADARSRLELHLHAAGKDPNHFPNAIATTFFHITEDRAEANHILQNVLAPTLNRSSDELRERLLVGPAAECAEKLAAYSSSGAHRIMLWPVRDELNQRATFQQQVVPLLKR
jgi:alkanesulfonate monooxygenase SsuD/methylene tetrahydromethanopterin reductase-like flavin-dependent oxidoreductase (luciferase family)